MPKVTLTKPRVLREPKCPECNKVARARPQSQAIGEFVDWLQTEKSIVLANYHKHTDACYTQGLSKRAFRQYNANVASQDELRQGYFEHPQCGLADGEYFCAHVSLEKLLAEFFGINLNKVEAERTALLDYIRAKSELDAKRTDIKV